MKSDILIKSYQNGLSLYIDPNIEFDIALTEIAEKFKESRHFFRDAKVALSIEGIKLTTEEEKQVVQTITEHSDIEVLCLIGKDESKNKQYVKALKRIETQREEGNGRFYKGTLKDGQVLESEKSIVVIGNVEKGAAVVAGKDIIIIGSLLGEAYAGANGEKGHFVVALNFQPEKCKIGDVRLKTKEKGLWGRKTKAIPQIAYHNKEEIVVQSITKELLDVFGM